MEALRRLAGHSLVYGVAGMAASLASFVLTPLYARYFGPATYGQLETLMALTQIVTILSAMGVGSAALFLIIQPTGEAPAVAGSALAVAGVAASLWVGVGWWLGPTLSSTLHLPLPWVHAVLASGALTALGQIPPAIWRARGQAARLAVFSLGQVLAVLGANLTLVAVWRLGIPGVLIGQISVQAIAMITGLIVVWPQVMAGAKAGTVRQLLGYGLTHVANSLSTWITQLSDRFLLAAAAAGPALGCYTLGNKIAAVAQLALAAPLALAWPSFLAELGRDRQAQEQFGQLVEWLAIYAAGLYLLLVLPVSLWVRLLGGEAYGAAAPLVPVLAAATLIAAFQPLLTSGFTLAVRFRLVPVISTGAAGLNIGLNVLCVPRYGIVGAAWTTLIACAVSLVAYRWASQRLWPLPVAWGRVLVPVAWAGLILGVAATSDSWMTRTALLPLYPLGIVLCRRLPFRVSVGAVAE
jgi:O-antigen/teichoic acid export membrane protein